MFLLYEDNVIDNDDNNDIDDNDDDDDDNDDDDNDDHNHDDNDDDIGDDDDDDNEDDEYPCVQWSVRKDVTSPSNCIVTLTNVQSAPYGVHCVVSIAHCAV